LLALRELEASAGTTLTVFFTLFHALVAGQKTCTLQSRTQGRVSLDQCPCNAMTNGAGLTHGSATSHVHNDVILGNGVGFTKWVLDDLLNQRTLTKVLLPLLAVYYQTPLAGTKINAGRGRLAATGSIKLFHW